MKIIGFVCSLLVSLVFCAGVGYANSPLDEAKKPIDQGVAVASTWHRRPEYAWHGRPEFKLTCLEELTNVKSLNVYYGDVSYRFDSDIGVEVAAHTNAYSSSLSFDVVVRGYLAIYDDPSISETTHVPFGGTNQTRRTFIMQWNGPSEVETVYLKAYNGLTLMLAGNGKPQYVAQIRLVSTDIKWNPEPSEDGYLYGRLPLAFDYAPVLFTMGGVLRVAEVRGSSQSGLTEIGEISIRVPMGQRQ